MTTTQPDLSDDIVTRLQHNAQLGDSFITRDASEAADLILELREVVDHYRAIVDNMRHHLRVEREHADFLASELMRVISDASGANDALRQHHDHRRLR
jgi:hypothetical protein